MAKVSKKEFERLKRANRVNISGTGANNECNSRHGFRRQAKDKKFNKAVVCTFVHYRKRLVDPSNLGFIKWIEDQIVEAGILGDDTANEITEIRHKQIKTNGPEYIKVILKSDD